MTTEEDLHERSWRVIERLKARNFDDAFLHTLAEYIMDEMVALRAEAKAKGWEAAHQQCRLAAFDRHMDVSSDFDEGYDSAVADIVNDIEALAANRLSPK